MFIPCTGPVNSTFVKSVRGGRFLDCPTTNFTCRIAYQMSDDGVTWSSTVTGLSASFSATAGWVYETGTAVDVTADQRNFVRFGYECKNASGTNIEFAQARMVVLVRPVDGRDAQRGTSRGRHSGRPTPARVGAQLTTDRVLHRGGGPVRTRLAALGLGAAVAASLPMDACRNETCPEDRYPALTTYRIDLVEEGAEDWIGARITVSKEDGVYWVDVTGAEGEFLAGYHLFEQ